MKHLMAVLFAAVPALIAGCLLSIVMGPGPFAVLIALSVFGLGLDVCLHGSDL